MKKFSRFIADLSNATKIRHAYASVHTVRNMLVVINAAIFMAVLMLCTAVMVGAFATESGSAEYWGAAICGAVCFYLAAWLIGLRRAVAFGQTQRQAYMATTVQILRQFCRRLVRLVFWGVIIVALMAFMAIILAVLIKAQYLPEEILTLFPSLDGIATSIINHVNVMLEKLAAAIG